MDGLMWVMGKRGVHWGLYLNDYLLFRPKDSGVYEEASALQVCEELWGSSVST